MVSSLIHKVLFYLRSLIRSCVSGWRTSPVTSLLIFCVLSLVLKENYPFSNFPMYTNPSPESSYFSITDGEGNDLPIARLTGVTCPKVGKIFKKKAAESQKKQRVKPADLSAEVTQAIGAEIFQYLRESALALRTDLPAKLQLRHTRIAYEDGRIRETPQILAQE